MQLKMLTILLRWNNMKYSLDNTAYIINDSNCGRLNQIYLNTGNQMVIVLEVDER